LAKDGQCRPVIRRDSANALTERSTYGNNRG